MSGYRVTASRDPRATMDRLRAVEPHAVDGGALAELVAGCVLYDLTQGGAIVGSLAVEYHDGDRATIRAAAGRLDDFAAALAAVEEHVRARGVVTVGLWTRRYGLLRNLGRAGYRLAQAEIVKAVA